MRYNIPEGPALGIETRKGRSGCQEAYDFVRGTKLATLATEIKESGHPIELADILCLAALYDLAAKKYDFAAGHMAIIANRFPRYEPNELFGNNGRQRSSVVSHEITAFRSMHPNFDFNRAWQLLEEEKSKRRKGLVKHCLQG
ncbi:MAG: hypothetical protein AABX12_04820 [Nanoarchaeota archaeon]